MLVKYNKPQPTTRRKQPAKRGLINQTQRQRVRGYSGSSIVLRMSREEIGSYLGLKIETVSRTFSKFQANGLLFVRHRQIQVVDPVGLQLIVDGEIA